MSEAWLSVGGTHLRLTGDEGVRLAMSLPGMAVFASQEGKCDVEVKLDAVLPDAMVNALHSFDIMDGQSRCRFGLDAEGRYCYEFEGYGRVRFDANRPSVVECSPIANADVVRFALWVAVSMAGLWHGVVPVHASAVVCDGRAVLCLGESGTGKSTHTRLWLRHIEGCHLLNDDSPLLVAAADGVWVYGSPWSGKTPCYRPERWSVAALLRLEQRPENSIRRLVGVEAFAALQPSCPPCLAKEELLTDRLVAFLDGVLRQVAVYRMGCLPNGEAAMLSHQTIFGL
ncbi:MAG: hypothetical protein IJU19_07460 [Bacteroidales bacterium]|nr:hypothetical protein [Bacteroidales bacterium]